MSTKIYNGTRIPNMSMTELMQWLRDMRPRFEELIQNRVDENVVRMATFEFDERTLGFGDKTKSVRTVAVNDVESFYLEKKWFSTKTELAIFPLPDKILTIFYGEREAENMWASLPGVDPYGYWDNVDPDEEATEEEWKERRKDWEQVLIGDDLTGIPSAEGLGFQFTTDNLFLYTYNPRQEGRMDPHALRFVPDMKVREERMAEFMADQNKPDTVGWVTSKERKERIEVELKNVAGKLTKFESLEDLFSKKWD